MKLSKLFDPELILLNMKASTKEDVISQLVSLFCEKHPGTSCHLIVEAVIEREHLGNTNMGRGVCFPHARTDVVSGLNIICGVIPEGLDIATPDNQSLRLVVLLLTPRNISNNYLQTLSGLASFIRNSKSMPAILKATTPREFIDVIERTDIRVKKILTVGDVMTPEPITVDAGKTLKDVANIFFENRLRCLPVIDNTGKLVGDITETELLNYALPDYKSFIANIANIPEIESFEELARQEKSEKVADFMNTSPVVVDVNAPVIEAAAQILFKKAEMVSVLESEKLVGVITKTDIVSKIIRG